MTTVFNQNIVGKDERRLFLGPELGVQEYLDPKYPKLDWLANLQLDSFWRENETDLSLDSMQFKSMPEFAKNVSAKNLSYQILMDSVQGRAPLLVFLPFISDPAFESAVTWWAAFENLHSKAYDYILKSVYPNPRDITDGILLDPTILDRAESVTRWMDTAYRVGIDYRQGKADEYELMHALYLALVTTNILESCRFNVSFACNFGLAEQGMLEGIATIIEFIARDESYHVALTQNVHNILNSDSEQHAWKSVIQESSTQAVGLWEEARDQEKSWAKHLFEGGSLVGLNADVLQKYVDYKINQRMSNLGFKPFEVIKKNPLPWVDRRMNSKVSQKAPQELERSNYRLGAIRHSRSASEELQQFSL